jgi:hypothetical protein
VAEIAGYSDGPLVDLTPLAAADPDSESVVAGSADILPMMSMMDADLAGDADADAEAEADAEAAVAAATDGGGGGGGIILALLPLLMLLGGGF